MYLRFVRLHLRPEKEREFAAFYRERVIPALEATSGCLFAALLRPWRGEAHKSLTLWASPEDARAYEEGGLYHRLLREAEPFLSSATVWRVRLARDPLQTTDPNQREIPPEGYAVEVGEAETSSAAAGAGVFLRVVSVHVDPERLADFLKLYREEVLPVLRATPGCRDALLAEGVEQPSDFLSITLWDREEDAVRYELSGEFERLTARLRETFSAVYDWKLRLGEPRAARARTPEVASYHLAVGKRLAPTGADD